RCETNGESAAGRLPPVRLVPSYAHGSPWSGKAGPRAALDRRDLPPDPLYAPGASIFVQIVDQPHVDLIAAGPRLLEIHRGDEITQCGNGQHLHRLDQVGDLVRGPDRVHHAVVENGVDAGDEVVRGDRGLWRERGDLLAHVYLG